MNKLAKTKEERFLLAVYDTAKTLGSPYASVDRYQVGQAIGLHPRGIDTICKELLQTNFIKKQGDRMVFLTKHGEQLVMQLLF